MATLNLDRQKEIDSQVESILLNTGLSYPENNLLEIASAVGIKVVEAELNQNINGVVQYINEKGKPDPVIIINKGFSPQRKVFTLAHELGHFMLHRGEERFRLDKFDYSGDSEESKKETEANYFAASLLVPKDKLIRLAKLAGGVDVDRFAQYFGVSRPVIENRMKWIQTNR